MTFKANFQFNYFKIYILMFVVFHFQTLDLSFLEFLMINVRDDFEDGEFFTSTLYIQGVFSPIQ